MNLPSLLPADYHLHTPLCLHAEGHPVEYARRAAALGLAEIGFSDHNPMPEHFDDWRMAWADIPRYAEMVAEARAEVPEMPIRFGWEVDYLEGRASVVDELLAQHPVDYLIGSVHYLAPGWEVDHPDKIHLSLQLGTEEVWRRYWELYTRMIRSRAFDIHAHPDLPKKFGHRPEGDLRRFYEPAIQALADTNGVFEVNTAGLRKDCRERYPAQEFLELAQSAGIALVISSDAHAPEECGFGFAETVALVKDLGFSQTVRLAGRKRVIVDL